jgi:hypothetical protein
MNHLRTCPHRELIAGSLATPADLAAWAAEQAAAPCERCDAPVAALTPTRPLPPLPEPVALALSHDGRDGARRAQRELDRIDVAPDLYPAIVAQLRAQPGTGPFWRRWWSGWRDGALVNAA